jgi:hypothetical protein
MSIDHTRLTKLFLEDNFIISDHARVRMFQRNVSTEDIGQVILYGEMIEEYTDDEPCPWICGWDSVPCRAGTVQRSYKSCYGLPSRKR